MGNNILTKSTHLFFFLICNEKSLLSFQYHREAIGITNLPIFSLRQFSQAKTGKNL